MDNQQDKKDSTMPSIETIWASWAVWLGIIGLVANCMCPAIWELPASLFLGLAGIACAVLSRKGKPFSDQAKLGLILSIIAAATGLIMALVTIFSLHMMGSDSEWGEYYRQIWYSMEQWMENLNTATPPAS